MSETMMVKVEHLRKIYRDDAGEFDVLKDVTFSIKKGEMVALLGVSGAGKTTLLQILGGLDNFNSGKVTVSDLQLGGMSMKSLAEFRNRHIGFVFQFHHLLPDFTALENVIIPAMILGKSRKKSSIRAAEILDIFGLSARLSHFPSELSGGERQRVALARALINNPALIMADEPTGNLDKANGELLLQQFQKANRELNQTFLIATHNSQLTSELDRVLYLEDGCMIKDEQHAGTTA